jgi:8-oxo-dGTP pyrophosphatase MutT (NUDIX family)
VVDESKAKADWLAAKQLKADSLKIGTAAEQKAAAKALTLADDLYLAAQGASDAAASALSKLEDEDLAASAIAPAAPTVATAAPTATTVFTEAEAKQHALNEIEYLAAGPKGTLTLDAFWKPEQDFQVPSTFYTNGAKKKAIVTLDAAVVKDLASVVLSAPKSALVSAVETPGDLPVLALQKGKYTVVQGEAQAWSMLKQSKPFKCHVLDYDANPKLYDYSTPLGAPKYKSPKKIPGATVQAPIPLPPAAPVKAPPYVHAPPHTPAPAKAPAPYVHAPPHTPAVVVAPIPLPTPVSSAALADKDAVVRWATGTPMHENELLNGIALKPKTPGAPDVWTAAGGHKEVALSEPPMVVKPHMKKSAGCIIVEPDGRIWLVEPKGGFGGYSHTFPKGGIEPGLTLQQTAKKEVFEEAGLECEITGYLGDFEGQTSNTRYYIARRTGGAPWMADAYETSNVKLLTPDQALGFLNADRDKKIIAAFKARTPPLTLAEVMETKTGSQAGSNVGGFYTGKDGVKRYVKEYSNSVQSGGEHLANKLYGDLGVLAPKSALYTPEVKNGRTVYGYSSEIIQGKKLQDVGINADNAKKMLDGFVADVLMGNRDVLGLTMDNVLITPTGAVARIDNGGAFLTQATGPIKSDAMRLGLQEWDGYFTHNPHYKKVLDAAGIKTHEDMRLLLESQLTKVLDVRDAAGGWAKYVEARTPTMDAADRAKIIEMLDKRTAMIEQKVVAMRPPPAPMAPGRVQPLGGKGALSANHPGRPRAVLTGDELHPPPPDMANLAIRNFAQLPKEKVLEKDSLTPDGSAVAAYDKKEIAHLKALKPDSKSGVVRFTGNDYKQMRAAVSMTRDEFAVSKFKHHDYDSCRRDGLLCEKAFTEVTPIPGRVFRNMGDMPESVIKVMMEDDEYGPGKRFNLMGCASTSRKANTGFMGYSSTSSGTYNVRLIIHQQSGIGINDISRHIGEGEVLLSKDTAFRVLRRAMGDGGTGGQILIVELEEIFP